MAQHKSAKKRIVRNEKRRVINHARISRIRTFVKKVENAIAAGNKELAAEAFKMAQPELHRGVTRGVLLKNTVARKLSSPKRPLPSRHQSTLASVHVASRTAPREIPRTLAKATPKAPQGCWLLLPQCLRPPGTVG